MVHLSIVAENSIPKLVATTPFQPKQYCGLSECDGGTDISNYYRFEQEISVFQDSYQERLVFYYFKNNTKRYPKMGRLHIQQCKTPAS